MEDNKRNKRKEKALEAPKKLKILVTIVDRKRADYYKIFLENYKVNFQTIMYARGTAPSDVMKYLGLIGNDKAFIISVVQEDKIKEILSKYEDELFKTKINKGIAFTVPIKSMIGVYLYQFLANIEV